MTIPSIDTAYRGCYFRSRLEARWALAFDLLKIRWRYEPEAYRVGPGQLPYLPDFHLPDLGTWVEVKGDETDFATKADTYAGAVNPKTGLPGIGGSAATTRGLLILGPIPDVQPYSRRPIHTLIQHGDLGNGPLIHRMWAAFTEDAHLTVTAIDPATAAAGLPDTRGIPFNATPRFPGPVGPNGVAMAYTVARAARFDRGTEQLRTSINAAIAQFKQDMDTAPVHPDDEIWTRDGDMETAEPRPAHRYTSPVDATKAA